MASYLIFQIFESRDYYSKTGSLIILRIHGYGKIFTARQFPILQTAQNKMKS
jgi:hypothetical protein